MFNGGCPRAALSSYDSLMGTTTDSKSENVRRRKAGPATMREIQSEGRAMNICTRNNNTSPRNRRKKLSSSQSRILQDEGCSSKPMEIDVSTKNLSSRKSLQLGNKEVTKF